MIRIVLLLLLLPFAAIAQTGQGPMSGTATVCPPSSLTGCTIVGPLNTTTTSVLGTLSVNGQRPATQADDSTAPFATGNTWTDPQGQTFQSQDVTAGYAMWQQVQSNILPGDVIGLNVSAASYVSGSSGCTVNEVLTFTGGAQIKVTACAGSVPSAYSITQSRMHACMPGSPTSISPLATTGGDGSSVWNLTIQSPVALYGTRLLTRCYAGKALNVVRSDTGEASDIGFLSDGSLDAKTLDGFTGNTTQMAQYVTYASGVNPRIAKWYDQGGLGNDATQATAANQPTIFPGRLLGNSRSIMFDARTDSWDPAGPTFLTLPAGVSVAGNNHTLAVLAGVTTNYNGTWLIHVGAQSSLPLIGIDGGGSGLQCQNNTSNKINNIGIADEATLYLCASGSSATTFWAGNSVASGSAGTSSTLSGGTLGEVWNATASYPLDEDFVAVVPWSLTATEQSALQAAVAATFGTTPQKRGVVVAMGDSHMDAWGYPYQQHLLRQIASLLGRPDISFVNIANAGIQTSSYIASNYLSNVLAPTLAAYSGNKYVYLEGGYNDINTGGQTVAQVEATYTSLAGTAHADGAKVICDTDVIRNATLTLNQQIQTLAAWMRATPSVCDYVFNSQAYSVFNAASGPWNLPWFEQQDSGIHMSAAGNALRASMFKTFVQQYGLFK